MAGKSIFMLSLTLAHWPNEEGVGSLALKPMKEAMVLFSSEAYWLQMQDSMLAKK